MKYTPEQLKEKEDAFRKLLAKGGASVLRFNSSGKLSLGGTLENLGFCRSYALGRRILKEEAAKHDFKLITANRESLTLSKKTKKLGWATIQSPAIYAVVNTKNGRKYIGASVRPDLRRAVHLYWLNNVSVYATSNVFFRIPDVEKDVNKYGAGVFEFEILKSYPRGTKLAEMVQEEQQIIANTPNVYNLPDLKSEISSIYHFINRDEVAKKMDEEYNRALSEYRWAEKEYPNVRAMLLESTREIKQLQREGRITCKECDIQFARLKTAKIEAKTYLDTCRHVYLKHRKECALYKKNLMKKFSKKGLKNA